jgi:hypothetical protein
VAKKLVLCRKSAELNGLVPILHKLLFIDISGISLNIETEDFFFSLAKLLPLGVL